MGANVPPYFVFWLFEGVHGVDDGRPRLTDAPNRYYMVYDEVLTEERQHSHYRRIPPNFAFDEIAWKKCPQTGIFRTWGHNERYIWMMGNRPRGHYANRDWPKDLAKALEPAFWRCDWTGMLDRDAKARENSARSVIEVCLARSARFLSCGEWIVWK